MYRKVVVRPFVMIRRRGRRLLPILLGASIILIFLNVWMQDLIQAPIPRNPLFSPPQQVQPITNITVEEDARVYVYSGDDHPIPKLMSEAKAKWEELKNKQSKTFREAVAEYKRRYGQPPPKGFDKWYAFARANNVLLIDEFDLINSDLKIFRAFTPQSLQQRTAHLQKTLDKQWTMRIENGKAIREGDLKEHERAKGVVTLMERFVHLLPDMTIVHNGHDHGRIPIVWEERERLERLVRINQRDHGTKPFIPKERGPFPHHSMPIYCHENSAVREPGFQYEASANSTGYEMPDLPSLAIGTFIGDFKKYMDVCYNPQYRNYHAVTSWVYEHHPMAIVPFFTPGVQAQFADIYTIITEQLEMRPENDLEWEERPFDMLQWRGQTSGPLWVKGTPWKLTQRSHLHLITHQEEGEKRMMVEGEDGKVKQVKVPNLKVNSMYFDTGMVGPAVQCIQEDGTCDEMNKVFNGFDPRMSLEKQSLYKYVLDVDGNAWSGRFRRLMMSNAAVVKATIYREFWTDWAIPWLHFIPMQIDYSDMWDIMAFFRGDTQGVGAHDELGKEIAMAGKEWVDQCYRWEDLETYQYRLMLEYARLYTDDPKGGSKDFIGDASIEPTWDGDVSVVVSI